jgi:glycosyltransferase involved in cell wall biosynthesis
MNFSELVKLFDICGETALYLGRSTPDEEASATQKLLFSFGFRNLKVCESPVSSVKELLNPFTSFNLVYWNNFHEPFDREDAKRLLAECFDISEVIVLTFHDPAEAPAWVAETFPRFVFFYGDSPVYGVWRKRRFHLENLDEPKDSRPKIALAIPSEQDLSTFLSCAQDPKFDNGFVQNFLTCMSSFVLRAFVTDEISDSMEDEYPILIYYSAQKQAVRPWKVSLLYLHDLHMADFDWVLSSGASAILSPYPVCLSEWIHEYPILSVPNFIWPEYIYRAERRTGKVLVCGHANFPLYPDRQKLYEKVKANQELSTKYEVVIWDHSGNIETEKHGFDFDQWTKYLSSFEIAVFGSHSLGYLVRKYFEIPGAILSLSVPPPLMVARRVPDADAIGLVAGIHYLELDTDHFWSQLEWINRNPEQCKQISWNSYRWYRDFLDEYQKETFPAYVDELLKKHQNKKLKGWIASQAKSTLTIPVSVIIPYLNETASISEILKELSMQDYGAFDIVVVAREPAKSEENARWIVAPKTRNSAEAMNLGWRSATGEVICLMEPGEEWSSPHVLTRVMDYFAFHPEVDAIYGKYHIELEDSKSTQFWFQNDLELMIESGEFSRPASTLFFRKRILEVVGGFDPRFSRRYLHDLWLRVLVAGKVRFFPFLVTNRADDRQTSEGCLESTVELVRIKARIFKLKNVPQSLYKKKRPILVEACLSGMVCAIRKHKFIAALAFASRAFLIRPASAFYILRTFYSSL